MRSILFFLFLFSVLTSFGQPRYKVLNWRSDLTFNNYLVQRVHQQYDLRRASMKQAVSSSSAALAYRDSCRMRYKKLLGALPEKTDLKPQVTGTIKKDGYRIEKIIYQSIPHHYVTSSLYVPDGKGPYPAVLLFCGHEPVAKATHSYQKTAMLFVKNGFVVFVVDPISQGERHQLADSSGKPLTPGGTTEHTILNAAANLVGSGSAIFELWDNTRALDYLVTRPEVDSERIGCAGNSGGGTQVTYFIGLDDRVKVAAPCSYVASRERNFVLSGANDGCQHIMGEGKAQLEISDYLIMFAPKPLLILAGRYDFVDYRGTEVAFNEVKNIYSSIGQSDKVRLFTYDDGHGISKPKREATVTWFRKWLYNDSTAVKEPDGLQVLTEQDLACTTTGQVYSSFPDYVNDAERLQGIAAEMKNMRNFHKTNLRNVITNRFGISDNAGEVTVEDRGNIDQKDYRINKVILRKQNEIPVPVLTIYPSGKINKVILWIDDKGKQRIADSTTLVNDCLTNNNAVVIADLAGIGELEDPEPLNNPKYFNKEYRNAITALHIGSSLPAERTKNIGLILDYLGQSERLKNIPVELYARGVTAVPALHAAVINDRISKLTVYNAIRSFEDVLNHPETRHWYSNVIPGVLMYYDIADLQKHLGKRFATKE